MTARLTDPSPKYGGIRTGGRSAQVVEQILSATLKVLGESGYGALRVEEVAARSGVNKTTVYRRWPTKSQLVSAAIDQFLTPIFAPDTGNLEDDITDMFVETLSQYDIGMTRGLLRTLQAEIQDPEVNAILSKAREPIMAARRIRFDTAVRRGELPARTDVMLLMHIIAASTHTHALAFGEPTTRAFIFEVVCVAIAGARARWANV